MRLEHGTVEVGSQFSVTFQFHKGAIRTRQDAVPMRLLCHFNSIKVRLELTPACARIMRVRVFQFHKGAIRTAMVYIILCV